MAPSVAQQQQQHLLLQPQQQHKQPQKQQPLAAALAAAVEEALQQEAAQAAKWSGVPLGFDDEGRPGMLVLNDGREFFGVSYGAACAVSGEVVFNTGMVGYPESLSDPSYAGQILALTFPLIGNYGVPADDTDALGLPLHLEGSRVYVRALLTADYAPAAVSHWKAKKRLGDWLQAQGVPALWGVDTRALTKHLRQSGTMLGKVVVLSTEQETALQQQLQSPAAAAAAADLFSRVSQHPSVFDVFSRASSETERDLLQEVVRKRTERAARLQAWVAALETVRDRLPVDDPNARNLVADVSPKEPKIYRSPVNKNGRQVRILAVDCGMKANIYRQFLYTNVQGCNVVLKAVPWDYDFTEEEYDGLFISNGPGDPEKCVSTIKHLRKALQQERPIFGICLGNQLLALAAGGKTYKMKYGNRGMNQPVIDLRTTRCYITAQNHGFAVDPATLPADFVPLFVNANDQSNEGISHRSLPFFSAQFHPEAAGGPTDTFFLFTEFMDSLRRQQQHQLRRCLYTIPYQFPCGYRKVLLLGSGGLSIGQAGEFDYSGSQAIKALKEHNIHVILVNPNIATVQTSKHMAHRVYFVPVTPQFISEVLEKERPQGLLCSFGGQTALNCVLELHRSGILKKYDCRILGTPIEAIIATEDREVFAQKLREIKEDVAPSAAATTVEEAVCAAAKIGYPVLLRAAFALGGLGSGFAKDEASLRRLCVDAFSHSSQVFIDRSLKGWKEIEYEVVRDAKDNCIAICNMENLDPLGIHTGDSIVVAPSQTLSNQDYYRLRECALKVIRHLGIVGECNIQYAVDPHSDKYYIVEVNARLSRSSALASKATGYPLAYIAAKLALGHDLLQLCNEVTEETTACFEPALDYVVTKVPRWDMKKFDDADPLMGSAMKSVGEVMAVGRTFEESFQKALRMVNGDANGFDERMYPQLAARDGEDPVTARQRLEQELEQPSAARIWALAEAFRQGYAVERLHALTRIDPWFLSKLQHIEELKRHLEGKSLAQLTKGDLIYAKKYGENRGYLCFNRAR